jgi:DNA-binding SARP family transcriptional activator
VLEYRILGPLEVLDGDRPVRLGGGKQRAALAILLLSANRVVSVERLADDLYAGAPPVTAVTQVQRQVSELRKLIGAGAIETRVPGYVLRAPPGSLDLDRFEHATQDAGQAAERGDHETAARLLREALDLWRGSPLADLAYESFAQTAIGRLEELRLAVLERRFASELQLGHHLSLLPEIEDLVWRHPLREGLRAQLMLALYRAGRQADALDAYRTTRETLVGELGLEPSRELVELERRILSHDASLDLAQADSAPSAPAAERILLVAALEEGDLDPLLALVRPLTAFAERSLIVARLVGEAEELRRASSALAELAGAKTRTAAFTSLEPARDVLRFATNYDVELVLVAGQSADLQALIQHSPCDVAASFGPAPDFDRGDVYVPFGGAASDWAALELGAWIAAGAGRPLRLVGTTADPSRGRRDASRLLADASLAVQRVVGVTAEPLLAELSPEGLLEAVDPGAVVVGGFPARCAAEGLGPVREALIEAGRTVVLVHGGRRPGGLAPPESKTRFSWSLAP